MTLTELKNKIEELFAVEENREKAVVVSVTWDDLTYTGELASADPAFLSEDGNAFDEGEEGDVPVIELHGEMGVYEDA